MSKTQKASRCKTVKNPLGGSSQRNGVKNPKGLSLRNGQKPVRGCTFLYIWNVQIMKRVARFVHRNLETLLALLAYLRQKGQKGPILKKGLKAHYTK